MFSLPVWFQLPLPVMRDNHPDDKYLYEIIVETGPNDNHATTSSINFILRYVENTILGVLTVSGA